MNQKYSNTSRNLHEFLADTDGLTKQEVAEELRAAGVDVDKFNADVLSIVNAAQRKPVECAFKVPSSDVRTKSRSEILDLLEQIQQGVFGDDLADLLAARQSGGNSLGEQDLQALLDATQNREPEKS